MKFLDLVNIFPVNFRRELRQKWLRHTGLLLLNRLSEPKSCNSLLAGNLCRDGCDQHCAASQAVRLIRNRPQLVAEMPANGGLSQFGRYG